jgi:hypothetical protein
LCLLNPSLIHADVDEVAEFSKLSQQVISLQIIYARMCLALYLLCLSELSSTCANDHFMFTFERPLSFCQSTVTTIIILETTGMMDAVMLNVVVQDARNLDSFLFDNGSSWQLNLCCSDDDCRISRFFTTTWVTLYLSFVIHVLPRLIFMC